MVHRRASAGGPQPRDGLQRTTRLDEARPRR